MSTWRRKSIGRGQRLLWQLLALLVLCCSIAHGTGVQTVFLSWNSRAVEETEEESNGNGELRNGSHKKSCVRVIRARIVTFDAARPPLLAIRRCDSISRHAFPMVQAHLLGSGIRIRC